MACQLPQVGLSLHDDGFEPALKYMTHPAMCAVVPLGVDAIELTHSRA